MEKCQEPCKIKAWRHINKSAGRNSNFSKVEKPNKIKGECTLSTVCLQTVYSSFYSFSEHIYDFYLCLCKALLHAILFFKKQPCYKVISLPKLVKEGRWCI